MPNLSRRILCVDDEPNVLALRKVLLGAAGYDVLVAEDGSRGLESFRANEVDAAVLDYKMPGMMGDDLGREMRRLRPNVPLLLVTAYLDLPPQAVVMFDAVITKGESPLRLLQEIEQVLQQKSSGFSSDIIAIVNEERRYIEVSDGVCKLVGYSKEELLNMNIDALSHPSVSNTPELFEQYVRDGFQEGNFVLQHKSGAAVPIRYRARVLPDGSFAAEWFPISRAAGQQHG